jgi:small subunit ribosomal protein S16
VASPEEAPNSVKGQGARWPAPFFIYPEPGEELTIHLVFVTFIPMLKIRLQRVGRVHEPVYRLVLTESQNAPQSGKALEVLGSYDSRAAEKAAIKGERVNYWLSKGAQASDTAHNLLLKLGIIKGERRNILPKKIIEAAIAKANPAPEPVVEAAPAPEAPATEPVAETPAEESAPANEEAKVE